MDVLYQPTKLNVTPFVGFMLNIKIWCLSQRAPFSVSPSKWIRARGGQLMKVSVSLRHLCPHDPSASSLGTLKYVARNREQ